MGRERLARGLKGVGIGALTAFLALLVHVLAGGALPPTLAIVVSFAMAVWLSAMIAVLGVVRWLIPVAIAASQLALHWVFSASTGAAQLLGGEGGHGHALAVSSAVGGHAMWWAHVVAGALTLAVVLTWSRSCRGIAVLARLLLRALRVARLGSRMPARGERVAIGAVPAAPILRILPSQVLRRGPPVLA